MKTMTWQTHWSHRAAVPAIYELTDRLHTGHTARVTAAEITATVSSWLADVGAQSPLVEDLARAVRIGDWAATHALGERLSVAVAVAG